MRRTHSRVLASIVSLLIAGSIFLAWPGLVASPAPVGAIPLITIRPIITFHPIITIMPLDPALTVAIPDANLRAALHDATGVPDADPIRRGDLYALNGDLDLYDRGIVNLEGIQFCKNITFLNLGKNNVTSMPDLSGMTNLQDFSLNGSNLTQVPPQVATIPNLAYFQMFGCKLTSLPDFLFSMPKLETLVVGDNQITEIPESIGTSQLVALNIGYNKLTSIPDELASLSTLKNLSIRVNRVTNLPLSLQSHVWDYLDVQYNYIDLSSGSADDQILHGIVANELYWQNQLVPLLNLKTEPSTDRIALSWMKSPDFTTAVWPSKVTHYLVYLVEGTTLTELAILGPDQTQYTDGGLSPETTRKYYVGVEYTIQFGMPVVSRSYRTIESATLAEASTTPGLTSAVTPGITAGATPTATPTPSDENPGNALPVWAWAIGGLLLLAVLGCIAALVAVLARQRKK